MVAQGGYTELQMSGLDFTSLLKEDGEEEQQGMSKELARSQTVSNTSVPTVNDKSDQMPVGLLTLSMWQHCLFDANTV